MHGSNELNGAQRDPSGDRQNGEFLGGRGGLPFSDVPPTEERLAELPSAERRPYSDHSG
jgi:hypothetical protein